MPRVASRQRRLKVKPQLEQTDAEQEARKDAQDESQVKAKLADQAAKDKLRDVDGLEGKEYVISQSLAQSFGQKAIDHFKGDVDAMPKWRFARRYLGEQVILVDLFRKQKDYDAADVEKRRTIVKKIGGRYAALGPGHSRFPHADADLRAKYPSLVEQLAE